MIYKVSGVYKVILQYTYMYIYLAIICLHTHIGRHIIAKYIYILCVCIYTHTHILYMCVCEYILFWILFHYRGCWGILNRTIYLDLPFALTLHILLTTYSAIMPLRSPAVSWRTSYNHVRKNNHSAITSFSHSKRKIKLANTNFGHKNALPWTWKGPLPD